MRAIIVFFPDEHDTPPEEARSLEMQSLLSLTNAADPAPASPLLAVIRMADLLPLRGTAHPPVLDRDGRERGQA